MPTRTTTAAESLIDVLSRLALNWAISECYLESGRSGKDGWDQKTQGLESQLYPMQAEIERAERLMSRETNRTRKQQRKSELSKLQTQFDLLKVQIQAKVAPIDKKWQQADNDYHCWLELFWDARRFLAKQTGIGSDEIFRAALVGFDASELGPENQPLKQRLPEIVSFLKSVPRSQWKVEPWARPVTISREIKRRVSPQRLQSCKTQWLSPPRDIEEARYADPLDDDETTSAETPKGGSQVRKLSKRQCDAINAAIKKLGQTEAVKNVLAEAGVNEKLGRKYLRELERADKFSGFARRASS